MYKIESLFRLETVILDLPSALQFLQSSSFAFGVPLVEDFVLCSATACLNNLFFMSIPMDGVESAKSGSERILLF